METKKDGIIAAKIKIEESAQEKIVQNMMKELEGLSDEESVSLLGIVNLKLIKKLIHADVKKMHIQALKDSYPPELWKALQEKFPALKAY